MLKSLKRPFTIIVEGNIGSGKTSFINNFQNNKNILGLPEPVEEWKNVKGFNLLSLLYSDLEKWAFTFQTYVQLTMMKNHSLCSNTPVKMMERSLYSGRYVFIENLKNSGIFKEAEVAVLDEWFNWLVKKDECSVDLIVYLRTNPEVAFERIKKRCRIGEECIKLEYVENLHKCHEEWLIDKTKFTCPGPVLVLNANKNVEAIKEEYNNHLENHIGLLNVT